MPDRANVGETGARALVLPVAGGHQLCLRVFAPLADDPAAPVLVIVPAMGITASYYDPFAEALAHQGFPVVACDLRGHGASVPAISRRSRHGQQDAVAVDLPAIVAAARREFPGRPLVLLGHSIGGQLATAYLSRPEADADGLALIASGTPHHRVYPPLRALRVLLGTQAAALLGRAWGYFPGDRVGFAGRESAGVVRDWARFARTGSFRPDGADLDYERAMAAVDVPVLVVSVEGDLMHTPAAMAALTAKLGAGRVTERRYTAADAGQPLDRYRWVRVRGPLPTWVRDWWRDHDDTGGARP
ncbi:alpha/beta hydrolase family protein [Actinosynnema mirum]|uniref:Alpha/beta hydrolase fold protein n=1 Tax=Actinosynnema mirum (strain ATCC 29888 / DSM 43827 / JCM 3225 / NBRC 14064 / NCIMB 13271 / NRRL B-12336 / IMRU 3971 / 101) TaxID=446462 RepID=C6WBU4_ACTMD|nr:alpha/beta fold hydrolase [Actinosynnema mirum]ACU37511.1 alpha/beta hydrolase fold protein [Actinosynnema mirum DSM 43827]